MPTRRNILAGLGAFALAPAARAASPMIFSQGGAAISGFDTVSYFANGGPLPGRADNALMWKGAIWLFASDSNREVFEANPRAYAPQFGGYCAYAVAQGGLSTTDPNIWHLVNDKLYLIHSQSVDEAWMRDPQAYIERAEANWPEVLYG
ncbi:YHS domain-containing (seleno)protein [Ruegeria hyattellae]|uniref:YHS domain-containing (seleno)protein n=1 Tax=Ruegeria hyattellae TaxID=3233337 RepID=UPI00355C07A4